MREEEFPRCRAREHGQAGDRNLLFAWVFHFQEGDAHRGPHG